MFFEPNRTPYDFQFHIFGIPVRVHPLFWLVAVILGWSAVRDGLQFLVVWVACVFMSVLVHELGHVLAGQYFGTQGHIVLYGMGGLAVGSSNLPHRSQRIVVYFAGPLAGFVFLCVIFAVLYLADQTRFWLYLATMLRLVGVRLPLGHIDAENFVFNPILDETLQALVFINLLWGLVNLLPIWPLDGGQISRDVCSALLPGRGLRISLGISFVVAALLALHSIMAHYGRPLIPFLPLGGSIFNALLFGSLALQSFQLLQVQQTYRPWDDWNERDPNIWR